MIESNLSELLKANDITISELSEKISIGRKPLTQLANNESKMVKFETIEKVMNFFKLSSFDQLFTLSISENYTVSGEIVSDSLYSDFYEYKVRIYIRDDENSTALPISGNIYLTSRRLQIDLTGNDDIDIDSQTINFIYKVLNAGKYQLEVLARQIALTVLDLNKIKKRQNEFENIIFRMPQISNVPEGVYLWNVADLKSPQFLDDLANKYNLD